MVAHMNLLSTFLKLPQDENASIGLSFISNLIKKHCKQSAEAIHFAQYLSPQKSSEEVNMNDDVDDEAWAMESMALTPNQDMFELYGTPWDTIFRRWIMSLVDHFTSIQVLEQACVKLPAAEEIHFSLLGMDHWKSTLPDWELMEDIIHQLQPVKSEAQERYIASLKSYI